MKYKKTAIIFGISGQDGAYLANLLIKKKYKIIGITRNLNKKNLNKLEILKIKNKIKLIKYKKFDLNFIKSLAKKFNNHIKEIYFLSGESSPKKSFDIPIETFNSNSNNLLIILEYIRRYNSKTRLFYASSSEIFKKNKSQIFDEKSELDSRSPYATSKIASTLMIKNYREEFKLFLCSGILFNHESPLRSEQFVFTKIIKKLKQIKHRGGILKLGNIQTKRDVGWAPEYVKAMWMMLQSKKPSDFVIGTGKMISIKDFIKLTIKILNIKKSIKVLKNQRFYRKNDLIAYKSNPNLIYKKLGWKSTLKIEEIIQKLINFELY